MLVFRLEVGTHLIAASQYLSPDETTRVSHAAVANDLRRSPNYGKRCGY